MNKLISFLFIIFFPTLLYADTLLVYPDASSGATTVDGYVEQTGSDAPWATIRDGAGSNSSVADAGANYIWIVSDSSDDCWSQMRRSILTFDTSDIGSQTVNSVTFQFYFSNATNLFGVAVNVMNIYSAAPAANNNLANGDYDSLGTTAYCDTSIGGGNMSAGYNNFLFNATGLAAFQPTGITKIGVRNTFEAADSHGWWEQFRECFIVGQYADNGTDSSRLSIDYTPAATGYGKVIMIFD